jgi:hypothetical protein
MSVTEFAGRKFDYAFRPDRRNARYLVSTDPGDEALFEKSKFWTPGQTLDQGSEGACVPHGIVADAMASPIREKPADPQALAFVGYDWCRRNDVFPGEDYDGTDSNTGMRWAREMGWIDSWWWAQSPLEFRKGLESGPACIGIDWTYGAYEPVDRVLHFTGRVVGGHFIIVTGYTRYHRTIKGPAYRVHNQWGRDWGFNGQAYTPRAELENQIFGRNGEAAFARRRTA